MVLRQRRSDGKSFWSCVRYPNCRGTRNVGEENKAAVHQYAPIVKMPGSSEQEAIWKHMLTGSGHLVVNAGPGVGKTFTGIQGCLRLPKSLKIFFVAFNTHIAKEANGKLTASGCSNVEAMTFHGLGNRILKQNFKGTVLNDKKMTEILESLSPMPLQNRAEWRRGLNLAEKLCRFVKNYNLDYRAANFKEEIERVAEHHSVELNGVYPTAFALLAPALDACKKRAGVSCDFDDMIWLPIVLDLAIKYPADVIITDESQDLNVVQHELIFRATKPASRVFVVGDRRQSLYGFRGADTNSMDKLRDRLAATPLGVKELPMTITRRCPKSHVALAKAISPEIQALDDAPEGVILSLPYAKAVEEMKVGDLVLCRVNAELIQCAYALIKRRIRPLVKGRDIGEGLLSLLDKLAKDVDPDHEMESLQQALSAYRYEQEDKLMAAYGDKAESRILALQDKCGCLIEFLANAKTIAEMRTNIESLFEKGNETGSIINAVVLGTVHRTKGLEAERVFVLAPDLIPHPAAKVAWEQQQEKNIAWVACTRAKFDAKTDAPGTLIFCGAVPCIYNYNPDHNPPPSTHGGAGLPGGSNNAPWEDIPATAPSEPAPASPTPTQAHAPTPKTEARREAATASTRKTPAPKAAKAVKNIEPPF
jgi:DNA helicase-2/ATP-dependent DNA helicase PcrA